MVQNLSSAVLNFGYAISSVPVNSTKLLLQSLLQQPQLGLGFTGHITISAFLPQLDLWSKKWEKPRANHTDLPTTGLVMATFSMQILEAIDLNTNCRLWDRLICVRKWQLLFADCKNDLFGFICKGRTGITCYQSEAVAPILFHPVKHLALLQVHPQVRMINDLGIQISLLLWEFRNVWVYDLSENRPKPVATLRSCLLLHLYAYTYNINI